MVVKRVYQFRALLAALAVGACVAGSSRTNTKLQTGNVTGTNTATWTGTAVATSEAERRGGPPPLNANVTIHVAGDSTAAIFPANDRTGRVGWAAVLQEFFVEGVKVHDAAMSGRSSKGFLDEGLWASLKARVQPGDYVFIQFGHNDQKPDARRHNDSATTFRDHLEVYINETRAAGGFAVLLTPISRRKFEGSAVSPSHGPYPAAVVAVGRSTATPVIDMTEKIRELRLPLVERLVP
jgi:lysophospholipase L1-like esterase